MRIVKKLYHKDKRTLFLSKVFNEIIAKTEFQLNFEYLEFYIGHGKTSILDNAAKIIINSNSPLLNDIDKRIAKVLITFELYRLILQKVLQVNVPRLIEDMIVGKRLVSRGYSDDIAYIFYILMMKQKITGIKSFVQFNLPWIIFKGEDNFYYDLFYQYAKYHKYPGYELKARNLFEALQQDLFNTKNLKECINLYEEITNAGNQVQVAYQ